MTVLQKSNLIAEIKKYSEEREKFQINVIELSGAIKILQKQLQALLEDEKKNNDLEKLDKK